MSASEDASPEEYKQPPCGKAVKISRCPGVSLATTDSPHCMYSKILLAIVKALFPHDGGSGASPISHLATTQDNCSGGTVGSKQTLGRSAGATWESTQERMSLDVLARNSRVHSPFNRGKAAKTS